jgi:hypothetical protein
MMKIGISETLERIKEEFSFVQSQYHRYLKKAFLAEELLLTVDDSLSSAKLECEKLAQEKTEMQRHYVMVS